MFLLIDKKEINKNIKKKEKVEKEALIPIFNFYI